MIDQDIGSGTGSQRHLTGLCLARGKAKIEVQMTIIQASTEQDLHTASSIMTEVSAWLDRNQQSLWSEKELSPGQLMQAYHLKEFFIGHIKQQPAAVMVLQEKDEIFWPDALPDEAIYLHKLSVKNEHRGQNLSHHMMDWAVQYTRRQGRNYLRLDCDAARPKLNQIYQDFGFELVDRRIVADIYDTAFYQLNVNQHGA